MTCNRIREQITAYLLGDLDDASAATVRAHLETCRDCRAFAQEVEPTLALLRDALAETAPSVAPASLSAERRQKIFANAASRRRPEVVPAPERTGLVEWLFTGHPRLAVAAGLVVALGLLALFLPAVAKSRRPAQQALTITAARPVQGPSPATEAREAMALEYADADVDGYLGGSSIPMGGTISGVAGGKEGQIVTGVAAPPQIGGAQYGFYERGEAVDGLGEDLDGSDRRGDESKSEPLKVVTVAGEAVETTDGFAHEPDSGASRFRAFLHSDEADATTINGAADFKTATLTPPSRRSGEAKADATPAPVGVSPSSRRGFEVEGPPPARPGEVGMTGGEASLPLQSQQEERQDEAVKNVGDKEMSERPAPLDSVALTKSPVVLRGIVGSRSPGARGQALGEHGGEVATLWHLSEAESVVKDAERSTDAPVFAPAAFNTFQRVADTPMSTFAIDVDTASYTLARNYMQQGMLPPPEAVRTEEFVNFFDYGYASPQDRTFEVHARIAPSPFSHGKHLLRIGIKGRRIGREQQRAASLTFLVDTSGSMETPERLGLLQNSLRMLVDRLATQDIVSIVQYDTHARLVLDRAPASEKARIRSAIDQLQCSGSTNLEEGMHKAYSQAAAQFLPGGENRVLVMSDGMANLGAESAEEILQQVADHRRQGIVSSVFGFGSGAYNDVMLETLADKGDGTYAFVDSENEARRLFVDELGATLNTIAADAKIQVAFNPDTVQAFRQLGYENRKLADEQFRDDTVDAGEVGSGQSVTALYELELKPGALVASRRPASADPIATVSVRYRDTDSGKVAEVSQSITVADIAGRFEDTEPSFQLAAGVAAFAERLRGSPYVAGSDFDDIADTLRPVSLQMNLDSRVQELVRLVEQAGSLSQAPTTGQP